MADLNVSTIFTTNQSTIANGVARGAEVVAFSEALNLLFVLGAAGVDAVNPATGAVVYTIAKADFGLDPTLLGTGNSVAVSTVAGVTKLAVCFDGAPVVLSGGSVPSNGAVGVFTVTSGGKTLDYPAIRPTESAANGTLSFAVPDQLVFTPDGSKLLVAIEGEPSTDYRDDPLGGIAIIDVATGTYTIAGFGGFDATALRALGVRVFGSAPTDLDGDGDSDTAPVAFGATAAADLEPEYITVSADGLTAYVTLQEANAIATLDIASATVTRITPLGLKDYNQAGSAIDAHDQDGIYSTFLRPASGMYMPDGIASFESGGKTYLVTANEGDAREWGTFVEEQRVSAGGLDTTVFPGGTAATIAANATNALGRLNVSRFTSNTDTDAQFESIQSFGARSFSIWEVGTTGAITQVFDSGSALDAIIARNFPALYDDGRADNKGAEPESIALGTIDGELHAFVALERYNAVMVFEIDTTGATPEASYVTTISTPGDLAPELLTYVSDSGGQGGRLFVANESSTTTTAYQINAAAPAATYTLQILHASDFEAGVDAVTTAPKFAAIVDALEDLQANSITLSSGDNYIPSPFLNAQGDAAITPVLRAFYEQLLGVSLPNLATDLARVDIAILNAIGVQASVFGNHEFDLGTRTVLNAIDFAANAAGATTLAARVTAIGALFPYLSANLDFSGDADLNAIFTEALRDAASYATTTTELGSDTLITAENTDRQIAPWTVINEGGEQIGVLGLTTQVLASISSIGGVRVKDPAGDGGVNNTTELAQILQPYIDQMTTQGIDKIILVSHLQQFQFELELTGKLSGVDVFIAGGSDAVFSNGAEGVQPYPVFSTGLDGNSVVVVNTGGEYFNVGRLVVSFDADGNIIPGSVNTTGSTTAANYSGAYIADDATVASLYDTNENPYADGTKGGEVKQLTDAVGAIITAKTAVVAGYTDVYLQGQRGFVRSQETNFGNLSVDANIFKAQQTDASVVIGIKNGGGIREGIGVVGAGATPTFEPPIGGAITQLDIENALRFNNALSIVTFTALDLTNLLENALRGANPGATPGSFPHVGGVRFAFDATRAAGDRITSLAVVDDDGQVTDVVIQNAQLVGDPTRTFRTVLLDFNINGPTGGDNFLGGNGGQTVTFTNRVDLTSVPSGSRTYTTEGSEQDALADYLSARFATPATAFSIAETSQALDTRIQNLAFRSDTVFVNPAIPSSVITGTDLGEALAGTAAADLINAGGGDDSLTGGAGDDTLNGGDGIDTAFFSGTLASVQVKDLGQRVTVTGADGVDTLRDVERLSFADGTITLNDGDSVFDTLFYLKQNPDVFASGLSAIDHFRQIGVREGRDPNPFFDTSGYLAANPDVAASGLNPLEHFRRFGAAEQRDTGPNFDTALYLAKNPDVAAARLNALEHFLNFGQAEGRVAYKAIGAVTSDGFDRAYYLFANPDVAAAGIDPRTHFTTRGAAEGRDANILFDSSFYRAANPDVVAAGIDPLTHYALFGAREGRDPSAAFDSSAYLAANPDVAAAGVNPLTHYLQFGVFEGRAILDPSVLIA